MFVWDVLLSAGPSSSAADQVKLLQRGGIVLVLQPQTPKTLPVVYASTPPPKNLPAGPSSAADQVKLLQRGGIGVEPGSAGSSSSGQQQHHPGGGFGGSSAAGSNAWTDRRRWETDRTPGAGFCLLGLCVVGLLLLLLLLLPCL